MISWLFECVESNFKISPLIEGSVISNKQVVEGTCSSSDSENISLNSIKEECCLVILNSSDFHVEISLELLMSLSKCEEMLLDMSWS